MNNDSQQMIFLRYEQKTLPEQRREMSFTKDYDFTLLIKENLVQNQQTHKNLTNPTISPTQSQYHFRKYFQIEA